MCYKSYSTKGRVFSNLDHITYLNIILIYRDYFDPKIARVPHSNKACKHYLQTAPQREQPPRSCRSRNIVKNSDSAIGQHLLDNPDCAKLYNDDMFRIIGRARLPFHLAVFESIYIQTKKPPLCRQKEFVFSLGHQW